MTRKLASLRRISSISPIEEYKKKYGYEPKYLWVEPDWNYELGDGNV